MRHCGSGVTTGGSENHREGICHGGFQSVAARTRSISAASPLVRRHRISEAHDQACPDARLPPRVGDCAMKGHPSLSNFTPRGVPLRIEKHFDVTDIVRVRVQDRQRRDRGSPAAFAAACSNEQLCKSHINQATCFNLCLLMRLTRARVPCDAFYAASLPACLVRRFHGTGCK